MRLVNIYSHLNGYEHILVHKPALWQEIEGTIESIDAETFRRKVSKEKRKRGELLYDPTTLNKAFRDAFNARDWHESRTSYWVTADAQLIRHTINLSAEAQRQAILDAGHTPIYSYNQTDFVKNRIAIEVQLGKYAFVAYDLFVKHMAFYVGDIIDVGVEILPMKEMQAHMSSGIGNYEGEIYNIL